jgi:DNA-damage-inducible protein D
MRTSQNINLYDHFREVTKMVDLGSGSKREITEKEIYK